MSALIAPAGCTCTCRCSASRRASRLSLLALTLAVCDVCRIDPETLLGTSKKREHSRPRQLLYLLARDHSGLSSARIGHHLARRDHSTILYGADQMERLIVADAVWAGLAAAAMANARVRAKRVMDGHFSGLPHLQASAA